MRNLSEKLQAIFAAASFAEVGEVDTARWIMAEAAEGAVALRSTGAAAYGESRRPVGSTIVTGVLSVALYSALLLHQDEVNGTCARAGAYAVLPILTAFLFSFVHGTFTGRFWSVLGIEASSTKGGAKRHA